MDTVDVARVDLQQRNGANELALRVLVSTTADVNVCTHVETAPTRRECRIPKDSAVRDATQQLAIEVHLHRAGRQDQSVVDPAGRDEVEVTSTVHGIIEEQPRADSVRINQVLAQDRRAGLIAREIHVDVRVGRELDAGSSLIVVRVEVLVDSARALLLCVPESDREAAVGLVIEVADGVKVAISVKVCAGEIYVGVALRPGAVPAVGRVGNGAARGAVGVREECDQR